MCGYAPGSIPLRDPYDPYSYYALQQSQHATNLQNAYALMGGYPNLETSHPAPDPVTECDNEPSEFKWLKKRIDEILWHPRTALA